MQHVIADSSSFANLAYPTWKRCFATLAAGAISLLAAVQLAAYSQGVFTGGVDGATVFLHRYGGS